MGQVIPLALGFSWTGRVALAVAMLAPLALLMGMPFPTGISFIGRYAPDWVPWLWAVNSFATVLGPMLCVILAMQIGFRVTFYLAAGIYLAGLLLIQPLAARAALAAREAAPATPTAAVD